MRRDRIRSALPFAIVAAACVVGGGVVAAAIAPHPTEHGVWAVAYLVLVGGVAQAALGVGQGLLASRPPERRLVVIQLAGWNAGNAAVLIGTLLDLTAVVDVGGALLVVVLASLAYTARAGRPATDGDGLRPNWAVHGFRALVVIVLVSVPTGLVLAQLRRD